MYTQRKIMKHNVCKNAIVDSYPVSKMCQKYYDENGVSPLNMIKSCIVPQTCTSITLHVHTSIASKRLMQITLEIYQDLLNSRIKKATQMALNLVHYFVKYQAVKRSESDLILSHPTCIQLHETEPIYNFTLMLVHACSSQLPQ